MSVDKFAVEVGCRPPGGNVGVADRGLERQNKVFRRGSVRSTARNRPAVGCLPFMETSCRRTECLSHPSILPTATEWRFYECLNFGAIPRYQVFGIPLERFVPCPICVVSEKCRLR